MKRYVCFFLGLSILLSFHLLAMEKSKSEDIGVFGVESVLLTANDFQWTFLPLEEEENKLIVTANFKEMMQVLILEQKSDAIALSINSSRLLPSEKKLEKAKKAKMQAFGSSNISLLNFATVTNSNVNLSNIGHVVTEDFFNGPEHLEKKVKTLKEDGMFTIHYPKHIKITLKTSTGARCSVFGRNKEEVNQQEGDSVSNQEHAISKPDVEIVLDSVKDPTYEIDFRESRGDISGNIGGNTKLDIHGALRILKLRTTDNAIVTCEVSSTLPQVQKIDIDSNWGGAILNLKCNPKVAAFELSSSTTLELGDKTNEQKIEKLRMPIYRFLNNFGVSTGTFAVHCAVEKVIFNDNFKTGEATYVFKKGVGVVSFGQ